nr:hypothetical protein [Rhizobium sp. Root708]
MNGSANDLRRIVAFLRARIGHDFASYKRATLMRRVIRRMQVCRTNTLQAYADYLMTTPEEAQELLSDLLISVTMFFRDAQSFDQLTQKAIKPLFCHVRILVSMPNERSEPESNGKAGHEVACRDPRGHSKAWTEGEARIQTECNRKRKEDRVARGCHQAIELRRRFASLDNPMASARRDQDSHYHDHDTKDANLSCFLTYRSLVESVLEWRMELKTQQYLRAQHQHAQFV